MASSQGSGFTPVTPSAGNSHVRYQGCTLAENSSKTVVTASAAVPRATPRQANPPLTTDTRTATLSLLPNRPNRNALFVHPPKNPVPNLTRSTHSPTLNHSPQLANNPSINASPAHFRSPRHHTGANHRGHHFVSAASPSHAQLPNPSRPSARPSSSITHPSLCPLPQHSTTLNGHQATISHRHTGQPCREATHMNNPSPIPPSNFSGRPVTPNTHCTTWITGP